MKYATLLVVCLSAILAFSTGCSSRPKSSEQDRLYYNHGGDTLRRKRTETRTVTEKVWNKDTQKYDEVSSTKTLTVLEIEREDGTIIDYEASIDLANRLREGAPIPTLTHEEAARAGLIGDCVLVNKVVQGGAADRAGVQEDDLIISYNGEPALGYKRTLELIDQTTPEDRVKIVVERDGQQLQLEGDGGQLGVEIEDEWR